MVYNRFGTWARSMPNFLNPQTVANSLRLLHAGVPPYISKISANSDTKNPNLTHIQPVAGNLPMGKAHGSGNTKIDLSKLKEVNLKTIDKGKQLGVAISAA